MPDPTTTQSTSAPELSPDAEAMTRQFLGLLPAIYAQFGPSHDGAVERDILAAATRMLTAATLREREACAQCCDSAAQATNAYSRLERQMAASLAAEIRARSAPSKEGK